MSEFKCEVVRIKIIPHPNADAIEIAMVGDYQSIVKKNQFSDEDLAVYIPEQAVVPEWMLREMGMWDDERKKGGLSGGAGNRVRAIRLRGVVSQGLMYPVFATPGNGESWIANPTAVVGELFPERLVFEGDDVAAYLGITKYEPLIPSNMRGKIIGVDYEATHKYDFENLKKSPDLFDDGEDVVITEKIHGTLICVGVVPFKSANDKYYESRVIITSKGMGGNGFVLDHNDETNLYAQAAKKYNLMESMLRDFGNMANESGKPVFMFGEVFGLTAGGKGIQDLTYSELPLDFRAFDICVGNRGSEQYLAWNDFAAACRYMCVPMVPLLYRGPYAKETVLAHTDGETTIGQGKVGVAKHIREGCVVKSAIEERNPHFGRKIAKSISDAYLLRSNGTELN